MQIITVTLNPTIDITYLVSELVFDDTNRALGVLKDPGGKGIDVSRVISELGGNSKAFVLLGGYTGYEIKDRLKKLGLNLEVINIKGETRTNVIIEDNYTHDQIRINAPGPEISPEEREWFLKKLLSLKPQDGFLVLSGSIPRGFEPDIYRVLIDEFNQKGFKCILDADGEPLKEGVKAKPFMIKPNTYELERLLDMSIKKIDDYIEAGKKLLEDGIEIIIMSMGAKGAILACESGFYRAVPPRVAVQSTVGAGDSLVAAFVWNYSQSGDPVDAFKWGVAAGTATALTPGTQLCSRIDVENLYKRIKLKRIAE